MEQLVVDAAGGRTMTAAGPAGAAATIWTAGEVRRLLQFYLAYRLAWAALQPGGRGLGAVGPGRRRGGSSVEGLAIRRAALGAVLDAVDRALAGPRDVRWFAAHAAIQFRRRDLAVAQALRIPLVAWWTWHDGRPVAAVCQRLRISRRTCFRWLEEARAAVWAELEALGAAAKRDFFAALPEWGWRG